jgi:23S rRNA (pseudouridine1915-N3)-methyltransferase
LKITLASVVARRSRSKGEGIDSMVAEYVQRSTRFTPTDAVQFESEAALLASAERQPGRPAAHLVLLDPRGKLLTSEEFATYIGKHRDDGAQRMLLAIGPADGWTDEARARAHLLFSLGRVTLPHELARAVLAEQIYRALTILAGHPYHCGH